MHTPVLAVDHSPLVAVYGTLKRGLRNHHWLTGAEFLGSDRLTSVTLYDLGPYPGAKPQPSQGVEVEVFKVDAQLMAGLDHLEDHRVRTPKQGVFERVIHTTALGPAWLYLYNHDVSGCPKIVEGAWQPRSPSGRRDVV